MRSYGTEGRRGESNEIPASNEIYEYIIFRGADIKDLEVIQKAEGSVDPAILQSGPTIEPPKP